FSHYKFEGECPNKPAVAMEVNDVYPKEWLPFLRESLDESTLKDPIAWSKACVEKHGADAIFFDMTGTHQDKQNVSPKDAAKTLNEILSSVEVPVIARAAGNFDKQNEVITECSEYASRQIVLGSAVQDNYRTITVAALAAGHYILAESPIDVNIAKQLNILITQMNFPIEKIIIDPLTGGLGYGLEYTYSVMERIRLQAFGGDKLMLPSMVCCVGQETWKIKEVKLEDKNMGDQLARGINWEVTTAISLILSGANMVVVRHPESVKLVKKFIDSIFK
ncbi:acetyl-CoA decarbonylase/synthase complex subunit delta, partial [Thermoproteota archaeon]